MAYTIRPGDTLSALAARFKTSVTALAKANNIKNVDLIFSGASLKVGGGKDSFENAGAAGAAGGASRASGPSSVSSSEFGGSATKLAQAAEATGNRLNSRGWCAKGVADSLANAGFGGIPRQPSAYMYADVLARDSRFKEVQLTDDQIRKLPPGAVVVSDKFNSPGNPHGHIAVTLGNGRESSDHLGNLYLAGTQRVFIPV